MVVTDAGAGQAPFAFRSDALPLDLAATLMHRVPGATPIELLGDARALAA
ncbi:MAG: hypothetical protein JWQ18_1640, partial [Conexibacter sp.]|nr:hypothetical protein [Conexibacter sp.]